MQRALYPLIGLGLWLAAVLPAAAAPVGLSDWQPRAGDRFVVDTHANMGYLVNDDGDFAQMPVATGQNRVVSYIGKRYLATTPVGSWTVRSLSRWTSGRNRTFMRLYWGDNDYTSYGIHSNAGIDGMLAKPADERFVSYGCILVHDAVLDILRRTYELNGNSLEVSTIFGVTAEEDLL